MTSSPWFRRTRVVDAARIASLGVTWLVGIGLAAATPTLLLLGGWAGADSGSISGGVAFLVGIPWIFYIVCAGAVWTLVRYSLPYVALVFATIQLCPVVLIGIVLHR